MKRIIMSIFAAITGAVLLPSVALAHVVVTPNQAGVGQRLVFNVSVPNEKDVPVTMLKLDIPKGLNGVTPTVQAGWAIATDKNGDDVTAITWTGTIPAGQREAFTFSAQAPATATELDWKAYQTYEDGTVVHWDQMPSDDHSEASDAGPYSITKVTNDLASTAPAKTDTDTNPLPLVLSGAAVVISLAALFLRRRR